MGGVAGQIGRRGLSRFMHIIGPTEKQSIEGVSPEFLSLGIEKSQALSWQALEAIREGLRPGITETEAAAMAREVLESMGSPRSWHRPLIRFGVNTTKGFSDKSEGEGRLKENDIYFLDLGPNWIVDGVEYEGDVGNTFIIGEGIFLKECVDACRTLFKYSARRWKEDKLTGPELYDALEAETNRLGFILLRISDGHRLSEFPHQNYTRQGLTEISFSPAAHRWVLEVQIADPDMRFGAFYEDLLC